jgi:hypothetical protein
MEIFVHASDKVLWNRIVFVKWLNKGVSAQICSPAELTAKFRPMGAVS